MKDVKTQALRDLQEVAKSAAEILAITAEKAASAVSFTAEKAASAVSLAASEAAKTLAQNSMTSNSNTQLLNAELSHIKDDIKEIKEVLKNQADKFVGNSDWRDHLAQDADHEVRIRKNETWIDTFTGKMVGFGIGITIASSVITFIINRFIK